MPFFGATMWRNQALRTWYLTSRIGASTRSRRFPPTGLNSLARAVRYEVSLATQTESMGESGKARTTSSADRRRHALRRPAALPVDEGQVPAGPTRKARHLETLERARVALACARPRLGLVRSRMLTLALRPVVVGGSIRIAGNVCPFPRLSSIRTCRRFNRPGDVRTSCRAQGAGRRMVAPATRARGEGSPADFMAGPIEQGRSAGPVPGERPRGRIMGVRQLDLEAEIHGLRHPLEAPVGGSPSGGLAPCAGLALCDALPGRMTSSEYRR